MTGILLHVALVAIGFWGAQIVAQGTGFGARRPDALLWLGAICTGVVIAEFGPVVDAAYPSPTSVDAVKLATLELLAGGAAGFVVSSLRLWWRKAAK